MRLHTKAFGLSCGVLLGAGLFSLTTLGVLRTPPEGLFFLADLLPGYSVTWPGSFVGLGYGFVLGTVGAGGFSWLYNRIYEWFLARSSPHPPGFAVAENACLADENLQKASTLWGLRARERQKESMPVTCWIDSPLVQQLYIHPTISGNAEENWFYWVAKKYFPKPVQHALSIGCGDGCLERPGLKLKVARSFDAIDGSEGAIAIARQKAEEAGYQKQIHYVVGDLNRCELEPLKYGVVFSAMALHHLRALEHVLEQIRRGLKARGLFILNEYIGPDQFQWTEKQVRFGNEFLARLPDRYRLNLKNGQLKTCVLQPTREQMNAEDPSEAIRSSEIVPLVRQMFEIVEQIDYGGTLVNLALEDIAGNFGNRPEDIAILQQLFEAEKRLLREGEIPSDFTLIIARRS